jgi:Amt family ammonium transporter
MMKKTTSVIRLLAAVASLAMLGAVTSSLHAQSTPAPAASPAASATPAPTPMPFANATMSNQIAFLEAAHSNSDPTSTGIAYESDPGHNAWMMVSSAFVLMMTLPGLAFFYGGLVRSKNVLSMIAMCFGITCLVSLLWWAVGYSLVFGASFG